MTENDAVQETVEVMSQDDFASDMEMDEIYEFASPEFREAIEHAEELRTDEQRELEFLIQGGGGSFFGSNASNALGAEDRNWSSSSSRFADHSQRRRMFDYIWWLFQVSDPTVRNIVNAYTVFIRGGGSDIKFETEAATKKWKEFSEEYDWSKKERQILQGTVMFGETFVIIKNAKGDPLTVSGDEDGNDVVQNAPTTARRSSSKVPGCRVLNSVDISRVHTQRDDPDEVMAYEQDLPESAVRVLHHPDDVVHFTFDTLAGLVRGSPMLLPAMQDLFRYRSFRENRHWLNMVRSRVPLVITKLKGGSREVAALRAAHNKLPAPGSVWILNNTTDVKFPPLNVDAADARDDAKLFLRAISQGVNLPEFIVSADASNANYSSTVTAENPAMQMFQDLQKLMAEGLRTVIGRLIDVPRSDVTVTFPAVMKNFKDLVDGLEKLHKATAISTRTFAERSGFTWEGPDGEKARIEEEGGFDEPEIIMPGGISPAGPPGAPPASKAANGSRGPGAGDNVAGKGRATPPGMGGG